MMKTNSTIEMFRKQKPKYKNVLSTLPNKYQKFNPKHLYKRLLKINGNESKKILNPPKSLSLKRWPSL